MTRSEEISFWLHANKYMGRLMECFTDETVNQIERLAVSLHEAWADGRNVYICGNGGSAANAMHMANDFHYGIGACGPGKKVPGLRVEALVANSGVVTCLANDTGYENIYSHQLQVKARPKDILIVLSGSGNSANVVKALETAKELQMITVAVVAFGGGNCLKNADIAINIPVSDMQVAEDSQLVVGHICMQWLNVNKPKGLEALR